MRTLIAMIALAACVTAQAKDGARSLPDPGIRTSSPAAPQAAVQANPTKADLRVGSKKNISMYPGKEIKDVFDVPLIKDAKQLQPGTY